MTTVIAIESPDRHERLLPNKRGTSPKLEASSCAKKHEGVAFNFPTKDLPQSR
jgi:hypothetical protein